MKLEPEDYPLRAIGNLVYARRQSSPIATCWDDELAWEMADRLNKVQAVVFPPYYRMDSQEDMDRFGRDGQS